MWGRAPRELALSEAEGSSRAQRDFVLARILSFVILSEDCPSRLKREGQPQSKDPCKAVSLLLSQGVLTMHWGFFELAISVKQMING